MEDQTIDTVAIKEHAKNIVSQSTIKQTDACTLLQYEPLRITDKTAIPYPVPVIKYAGETISTPGALTAVSGASKSGKTAVIGIFIAGAITQVDYDKLDLIDVMYNGEKRKAVLHFEMEQAPWKHQSNLCTILKRANLSSCPDYYLSYNFRQLDIEEMKTTFSNICQAASIKFNGIHSIFIDGIADFIKDPNDPEASFDIVKFFEGIAQEYFCSVIVVLHTNPGGDKERGHLGSQVQRKAESIISVKKEGNVSYLEPKLLRHAGDNIPKIQFQYNPEKGYHTQCNVNNAQDNKATEKALKLKKISESIFSGQRSYKWGEAIDAVLRETGSGRNTAINLFKDLKSYDLILRGEDGFWRENNKTGLEV